MDVLAGEPIERPIEAIELLAGRLGVCVRRRQVRHRSVQLNPVVAREGLGGLDEALVVESQTRHAAVELQLHRELGEPASQHGSQHLGSRDHDLEIVPRREHQLLRVGREHDDRRPDTGEAELNSLIDVRHGERLDAEILETQRDLGGTVAVRVRLHDRHQGQPSLRPKLRVVASQAREIDANPSRPEPLQLG